MERKTYTNLNAVNYRENYFKVKDDDITVKIEDKYKIEIEELRINNKENIYLNSYYLGYYSII